MHQHWWFTQEFLAEQNREAERQAALERLYLEAGVETLPGLRKGARRLAAAVGGWLVAAGERLSVYGARGVVQKDAKLCACR